MSALLYPVRPHVFSEFYRDPRTLDSRMQGAPGIHRWRTVSVYTFLFGLLSSQFSFGHRWQASTLICCGLLSCRYFQCFGCFHFDSRTPGVPGWHGRNDGLDVITTPSDHCTSLHCQRGVPSISYPFVFSLIGTTDYPT